MTEIATKPSYLEDRESVMSRYLKSGTKLAGWECQDGTTAYAFEYAGKAYAIGFFRKSGKTCFHYSYRTVFEATKKVTDFLERAEKASQERDARKAAEKAERAAFRTTLVPGDIMVCSWGYEQTNVDFYQVLEVAASGKSIVMQEIASQQTQEEGYSSMSAFVTAIKDHFTKDSKPMRKVVGHGDSVTMTSYSSARKWDGRKMYNSWYA